MRDTSERLTSLLRGEKVDQPPYWEPWFNMPGLLKDAYGGDWLEMGEDLGMAAIPVGVVRTSVDFIDRHPAGIGRARPRTWSRREMMKLRNQPDPYWEVQRRDMKAGRDVCHHAGFASWITMTWSFHAVATAMGLEEFSIACYDEPKFVADAIDWLEHRNRTAIRYLVDEVRPDFVLFDGDCAYSSGTMIDPGMLRELCFEPTRATVDQLAGLGVPAVFHCDGKLDDVVPMLIDLGFAGVHGCEEPANELADLVERFSDRIALAGNMDVTFLHRAKPDEVRDATERMLKVGGKTGRFIAACHPMPGDSIPRANYRAFTETVAKYGLALTAA